jgi:ribulose-phosphate 3-epimerase
MKLGEEVTAVQSAGADLIHVDVMDGHFVPNLTIGPPVIKQLRKVTKLPLDVHLMIENPDQWVDPYADAGADWLTVHVEAAPHLHRTLQKIRDRGMKAGVSLNPSTPAVSVEMVLELCDHVLVMSVNPGFGGQKFISSSTEKIAALAKSIATRKLSTLIEVDGGITVETAKVVVKAGARVLVAGTEIFGAKDYAPRIQGLRQAEASK